MIHDAILLAKIDAARSRWEDKHDPIQSQKANCCSYIRLVRVVADSASRGLPIHVVSYLILLFTFHDTIARSKASSDWFILLGLGFIIGMGEILSF